MIGSLDILRMAQSFAAHAAIRQQAIAQNVANADTPGYRARHAVPFGAYLARLQDGGAVQPRDLVRPDAHPATVSPDGNTVSIEHEMMRATAARGQHEMALGIYSMTRDLMRASTGR
jgi:flagellar basal-body rod protein FlgB